MIIALTLARPSIVRSSVARDGGSRGERVTSAIIVATCIETCEAIGPNEPLNPSRSSALPSPSVHPITQLEAASSCTVGRSVGQLVFGEARRGRAIIGAQ